ncbi:MAG: transporter substrate-binding domain-containing protein, partial [Angelakisella sp.]
RYLSLLLAATNILLCLAVSAGAVTTNLKVAFNSNLPPYQFMDEEGNYIGMHIDILNAIAKQKNYIIEYIPMNTTRECLEAFDKGTVDMVLGYMVPAKSPYTLSLTTEISSSTLSLIMLDKDAAQNQQEGSRRRHVSVFEYGTASYSLISKLNSNMYLAVENQSQVYNALLAGKADSMIGVKESMLYQIYRDKQQEHYTIVNNYMATIRYAIITQKGDYELRRNLNDSIMTLRTSGEYEKIREKWTIDQSSHDIKNMIRNFVSAAVIVVILVGCYVVVNQRVKNILKHRVDEQTQEIQLSNAELERRMAKVQEVSDLQKRIIENSPSGMILFDRDYTLKFINNSACSLGSIVQPPVGTKLFEVPFLNDVIKALSIDIFEGQHTRCNQIVVLPTSSGERRTYRCNVHQTIEYGQVSGALLTIVDITTEEKEKQEAFEKEKSKALNRMVAGIAHEIKNPLMSIQTFATLIGARKGDLQVEEKFAEFVPGEIQRINKLVESLINYAKPVKGETEVIDINALVNECMYLTHAITQKGFVRIDTEIGDGLTIWGDKTQLKQVLVNIIINGIESMEKKIKDTPGIALPLLLRVSARQQEEHIILEIEDSGCGMTDKEKRLCTDPFFSTKARGTGLGLALSDHYIKSNNGTLLIESEEQVYTKITISFWRYSQ